VHHFITYSKVLGNKDLSKTFKQFMEITKPFDPIIRPLEFDKTNKDVGVCRVSHKFLEGLMKSTMKNKFLLVVNMWDNDNFMEI
jgi:hypothetical protein